MLSVIMLSVIMLSVIMLSVVMLSVVMLSVVMLSVVMLSVVMLNVVAPLKIGVVVNDLKTSKRSIRIRPRQLFEYFSCLKSNIH